MDLEWGAFFLFFLFFSFFFFFLLKLHVEEKEAN